MPGYKVHLAVATKINEKLKLNLDELMLGSLLPDLSISTEHALSHFQNGKDGIAGTANPDLFRQNYQECISSPIMIGYLIHLLTDKYYNSDFFTRYCLYDKENNIIGVNLKKKVIMVNEEKLTYIKHREFNQYDKAILKGHYLQTFSSYECINKIEEIKECPIDKEQLKKYLRKINKEIKNSQGLLQKLKFCRYYIYSKKEMDRLFLSCCTYVENYLESKKIKKNEEISEKDIDRSKK